MMDAASIRVLICDDQELARAGLCFALEATPGISIVGHADSGRAARELAAALQPDVVLMDVVMPADTGVGATRRILQAGLNTKVLAVSMHTEAVYVAAMMDAGASGFVDKSCAYEELALAIREVMAGRKYLSPSLGTHAKSAGGKQGLVSLERRETGAPVQTDQEKGTH